ncbi:hypothetical protein [Ktedonobacter robiniae]|uniref:Uncharacterized protein n=1 Tax=Ktedonobacter robiniae TaxID=2778365 RepID=A0ABQ3V0A6_9CHLR|nr:hypothetical protein [Ktedonobacter robiniae]GHO58365.1 hypothetical protein KSB_68400 [Ktedonobacter robiniae]
MAKAGMLSRNNMQTMEKIRLNYASHANYADYKIADKDGNIDGRQGVRLGQPGVRVLDVFRHEYEQWVEKRIQTRFSPRLC